MDKARMLRQVAIVKQLVAETRQKLDQIEAIYIGDLYKSCQHDFDEAKWVDRDLTTQQNHCKICGFKAIRQKVNVDENSDS